MKTRKVIIPAYDEGIIGDAQIEMSVQCLACKHLHNDMTTCEAFSDEIPVEILTGNWDHTKPFKDDNDVQFESVED